MERTNVYSKFVSIIRIRESMMKKIKQTTEKNKKIKDIKRKTKKNANFCKDSNG